MEGKGFSKVHDENDILIVQAQQTGQKQPANRKNWNFETTSAILWQSFPFTAPEIQQNEPGCGLKRPCCWNWIPLLKKKFILFSFKSGILAKLKANNPY